MGERLPPVPGSQTFASVISDYAKFFIIALMRAYYATLGILLIISDCDVVGGCPLNPPVPMCIHLPKNLPHPLAGRVRIALYVSVSSADVSLRCYACVTVDDVLVLTNSAPMRDQLFATLTARFGLLTVNLVSALHTGIEIKAFPTGGVPLLKMVP